MSADEDPVKVNVSQTKAVPKFCTNVSFNLLKDSNVIVSLFFAEDKETVALIERVIIGMDHAKLLHETLGRLISDAKEMDKLL